MKYELTNPRVARELLERFSLSPKKGFGQNFLINRDVPRRIAEASSDGAEGGFVLEIGPGIGTLTCELAELYDKVLAVEIDRGLIPLLADVFEDTDNVEVIEGDFMKCDLPALLDEEAGSGKVRVCANLPYYVTTPVLMKILESFPPAPSQRIESITVMIQREVADRLCAPAGDTDYGSVTASIALYGKAEKLFAVSPGCFYPAPKVTSAVIRIKLHEGGIKDVYEGVPAGAEEEFASRVKGVIETAFSQRRKTLVNALSGKFSKDAVLAALDEMGLRPDVRGERLSAREYCKLADILYR